MDQLQSFWSQWVISDLRTWWNRAQGWVILKENGTQADVIDITTHQEALQPSQRADEYDDWQPDCVQNSLHHHHRVKVSVIPQYLSFLQRDLALFLAADERPVTLEYLVTGPQLMSKGCWEETDPVLNYPLKNKKMHSSKLKIADTWKGHAGRKRITDPVLSEMIR